MNALKLLFVEDNDSDLQACRDTVIRYNHENEHYEIELTESKSLDDALSKIDGSFDGVIIDLKLGEHSDAGNQVIKKIEELHIRTPIAVLTGTPNAIDEKDSLVGIFKKGEPGAGYADLFDKFKDLYNSGLTKIMGGRGTFEKALYKVFSLNLMPQMNKWVQYARTDSSHTEEALLRYTLSHLVHILNRDGCPYFPEEFYLAPPHTDTFQTGSIVQEKSDNRFHVILNPACDLVSRTTGSLETDHILVVEIVSMRDRDLEFIESPLSNNQKTKLESAFGNKKGCYHWLPKTDQFVGGFLNFKKLRTLGVSDFKSQFHLPFTQISPPFLKDIIARFSAYYARQGQPTIRLDDHLRLYPRE